MEITRKKGIQRAKIVGHNKVLLYIIIILVVALIALYYYIGQVKKIDNFEKCAAAGNPIMESYPRQCMYEGETFVEEIEASIGGERDEHGCLGPAGYSYNETLGGCVREWEQPGEVYCTIQSREADACIALYEPVCGYNIEIDESKTYSNSCSACMNSDVDYWLDGECSEE